MSAELRFHNVTSVERRTRFVPSDTHSPGFWITYLTVRHGDGGEIEIVLFATGSNPVVIGEHGHHYAHVATPAAEMAES